MSRLSKIWQSIPVDVKNRSGFDLSHENILTLQRGTITPILVDELLPNDSVSLGYMAEVQLPPLATNAYGRIDCCIEAFFVPYRVCWGNWKSFFTYPEGNPFGSSKVVPKQLPFYSTTATTSTNAAKYFGPGTLADYLGFKVNSSFFVSNVTYNVYIGNFLPFIAYWKIWDNYYRNKTLSVPAFVDELVSSGVTVASSWASIGIPSSAWFNSNGFFNIVNSTFDANGGTSYNILSLVQRQWERDRFTTCALYPQAAAAPANVITFGSVSGASATSTFSISQLRSANTLQRFLERINIAGYDYANQVYAMFGTLPSDKHLNKPVFLGASRFGIYNRSVYDNMVSVESSSLNSKSPYAGQLGAKAGDASGQGRDSLVGEFTAKEHGFLFVNATIVPHAYYGSGSRRYLGRSVLSDFANPLLEGLGEQAVHSWELYTAGNHSAPSGSSFTVYADLGNGPASTHLADFDKIKPFGYQQQYSEYKYMDDEVHGYLRQDSSLASFTIQRFFGAPPTLGTNFVTIPTTALDNILAVESSTSGFVAYGDFFFNYKKVSTLSEYVIPTLGDMKDTHKVRVDYRGQSITG